MVTRLRQEARVIERFRIIEVAEREGVAAAARQFECSRTTVYALQGRYQRGGLLGLASRPRGPREPLAAEVVEMIVELKLGGLHRSSSKIRQLLAERYGWQVSRQSVWRVLSGRGLARVQDREPLRRFERPQPNQLWQMDFKESVRFRFGKAHLLAVIDDASRFCLGGEWITTKAEPAAMGALAKVLERWGLPEAILTDRDTVFYGPATRQAGLTTYQLGMETLGVRTAFCKPYKPRGKGKVEKFIQFVEHDFLAESLDDCADLADLNRRWLAWTDWYNCRRPHASLGELPPARRFQASRRAAPRELRRLLQVPALRKVRRDCTISIGGKRYALPADLIGRHVWVGRLADTITIEHAGRQVATFTTGSECPVLELQNRPVLEVT
jgi:transposase InsO family protein